MLSHTLHDRFQSDIPIAQKCDNFAAVPSQIDPEVLGVFPPQGSTCSRDFPQNEEGFLEEMRRLLNVFNQDEDKW